MRIALLSLHAPANYGSNLQALAVVRLLESEGQQVEVLDYRAPDDEAYYKRVTHPAQIAVHREFIAAHLPLSPQLTSVEEIRDHVRQTKPDAVLVGSDAVLRTVAPGPRQREVNRFGNPFWLEWLDADPELSHIPTAYFAASSMGSVFPALPEDERLRMKRGLSRRCFLSVRDYWTKWMLEAVAPIDAARIRLSYDPVLGMPRPWGDYPQRCSDLGLPPRYIVLSGGARCRPPIPWVASLRRACHAAETHLVELPNPDTGSQVLPVDWTPDHALTPWEWTATIAGASGYVGPRFHPVVVALQHGVPILAVDDYGFASDYGGANLASKTFDICYRLGLGKQVLATSRAFELPPQAVVEMLRTEHVDHSQVDAAKQHVRIEAAQLVAQFEQAVADLR